MGTSADRRLTRAEGRRFGLTLSFGFAALGALLAWRGGSSAGYVLFTIAGLLLVSGVLLPTYLGPVSRAWNAFGAALSRITSPVFFTLIYMVVVAPIGVLRRTLGRSPLARDRGAGSYWVRRSAVEPAVRRAALERQF